MSQKPDIIAVKSIFFYIFLLFLMSCGGGSDRGESSACSALAAQGSLSGLAYTVPELEMGQTQSLTNTLVIANGQQVYSLEASCESGNFSFSETLVSSNCNSGFFYNSERDFCESETRVVYESESLDPEGRLRLITLDNSFEATASNEFKVLINGVETLSSTVEAEILNGKLRENNRILNSVIVLSQNYDLSASPGDQVCFQFTSENRDHCYSYSPAGKTTESQALSQRFVSDFNLDLLNANTFEKLNFRGNLETKNTPALNERKETINTLYQELDFSGLYFNAPFSLEQGKTYRLELETNSDEVDSRIAILIYRKTDFDLEHYQEGFLKKFYTHFSDDSLRRKKVKIDFTISDLEQSEELTILIYGEKNALVRDFKLSEVAKESIDDFSLFLTASPNRAIGFAHFVPNHFVPFGLSGGIGYGTFQIDNILESYEIYVNYEDRFQTTGAHLYEKFGSHDAWLSWNFRGQNNSAPGGNSQDFLHGTLFEGDDWPSVKSDPATAVVILHAEGGSFATNSSGFLLPYSPFSHEVSEGGVLEGGTRFNNRVPRRLTSLVLKEDNINDPSAPFDDPLDLSNQHTDYFLDQFGQVHVENDASGVPQLTPYGSSQGSDLFTDYLFYLYDDQGVEWARGGPEGALAGVLTRKQSFEDFLIENSLSPGEDSDGDGFDNYIEYISNTDPNVSADAPFVEAYDLFDDQGNSLKAVTLFLSKSAKNFNVHVYEMRPNGVETVVWSFDRGRGFESKQIFEVVEKEDFLNLTIVSTGNLLEISDMRIEFMY